MNEKNSKKSTFFLKCLFVVLIIAIVLLGGFLVYSFWQMNVRNHNNFDIDPNSTLIDNPIDFKSLKEENPDIYAWINIPDTEINYPILQSSDDDSFYISHDYQKNYAWQGSIFTEMQNAKDFSDPVTVIYGHQTGVDSMFTQLHYFEDANFFAEHDTIYICTEGHLFTYRVISAYQYDNRHILNCNDFTNSEVVKSYFDFVCNPASLVQNIRSGILLNSSDKIIQLSTCLGLRNSANIRYLVTGVLVNDQATK